MHPAKLTSRTTLSIISLVFAGFVVGCIGPIERLIQEAVVTETPYEVTPSQAAPTAPSTSTPTDRPTPSATYTPIDIEEPPATPTPAIQPVTPVPTTASVSLAPVLLNPQSGRSYGGNQVFSWQWYRGLSNEGSYGGEYFALRIWPEGGEKRSITWSKETSYEVPLNDMFDSGTHYWNVAVVRQTAEDRSHNWEYVSLESEIWWFIIEPPKPPIPTPTPEKPRPTPTPPEP